MRCFVLDIFHVKEKMKVVNFMYKIKVLLSKHVNSWLINSLIPSFHFKDNSVHFHECSPFWEAISTIYVYSKTV